MIKFNNNLEGDQQFDQENGGSCAKLSNLFNPNLDKPEPKRF